MAESLAWDLDESNFSKYDGIWPKELFAMAFKDDGWTFEKSSKHDVKVFSRSTEDNPLKLIRGTGVVDAPLKEVAVFLSQWEKCTPILDIMFEKGTHVKSFDPYHNLYHGCFNMPFPLSKRDFIYYGLDLAVDGVNYSVARSFTHPDIPEAAPYVRGAILASGYVFRPLSSDNTKTEMEYIVQVDPKGWIPTILVNLVAKDQAENVVRLIEYYNNKKTEAQAS